MADITRINLSSLKNEGSITGKNQLGSTKQAKSASTVDYTDGLSNKDLQQLDENKDGYIDEQEFRTAMEKAGKGDKTTTLWNQYLGAFQTKVNTAKDSITSDASKLAMVQMFSADGGSKIHPAIIQEFVSSLVTAMGTNDFPKSGVHDLIHNGFKAICQSKNIQVTTEDLNVCEELLNNFIEKNGSKHGDEKYITALDMQKAITTHAEKNTNKKNNIAGDILTQFKKENDAQAKDLQNLKPQFKELLTLTGEKVPEKILNALVDALAAYLPSNTVDLNNLDNLMDNLFVGYLDALNPPVAHTQQDMQNVKSMLRKFAQAFAGNDKDNKTLSGNDVSKALKEGAKVELSSTMVASLVQGVEGGDELSPELLTAVTDKVIIQNIVDKANYFQNNGLSISALCNTYLSDFPKADREKAAKVIQNFIEKYGNNDGDNKSLSVYDVNKAVTESATGMLQGSKNTITQLLDDAESGLSGNLTGHLADFVSSYVLDHIIMENQVDAIIDNDFVNYLQSKGITVSDTDLTSAKTALKYLITNNPRYNSESFKGLHWEGLLAEGAIKNFQNKMKSNTPLLTNLLTENGKANIKTPIASALSNFIVESLKSGDINTSDINKLINTNFEKYLKDNNIPYTPNDLSNAKTVFEKFVKNFESDGYRGTISDRDISKALATKQDISDNLTKLGGIKEDTIEAFSIIADDKISSDVLNQVYDALLTELSGDKTLSKNQITNFFNKYLSGLSATDKANVRAMLEKLIDGIENIDEASGLSLKDLADGAKGYSDAVKENIDSIADTKLYTISGLSHFADDKLSLNTLDKVYTELVHMLSTTRTLKTDQVDDFIEKLNLSDDDKTAVKTMLEGLINFSENLDNASGLSLKDLQDVTNGYKEAVDNNITSLDSTRNTMLDGLSLLSGDNLSSDTLNQVYNALVILLSTGRTITTEQIDTFINRIPDVTLSDSDKTNIRNMLTSLINGAGNLDNTVGLSLKDFQDLTTWYAGEVAARNAAVENPQPV